METHAPSPGIPFIARSLGTHRPALSGAPSSCPGSPGVQGARQPQPHPRLLQVRHWILTPQLSLLEPESELVTALGPWHLTFPASPSSSFTLYLGDPFLEGGVPGPPSLSAPCRLILRGSFHSCSEIVTCTVRLADVWSLRGVPASVLASGTADGLPARLVSRLLEGFSQLVGAGSQHCPCRSPDLGRCLTPEARGSSWPVSRLSGLRVHIGRMETELPCSRASGGLRDEQRINEQQVGSPPVTLPPAGEGWRAPSGSQSAGVRPCVIFLPLSPTEPLGCRWVPSSPGVAPACGRKGGLGAGGLSVPGTPGLEFSEVPDQALSATDCPASPHRARSRSCPTSVSCVSSPTSRDIPSGPVSTCGHALPAFREGYCPRSSLSAC